MSELSEAISEMRNMREAYDQLAQGVISDPIVSELESGKAAIVSAINAMGGTATASMSMGELAQAIHNLILVQLGELEYNIPIESAEQAMNLAQINCTKFVDDYTTRMYTPLIVDEWQAVEEVRYKRLLSYDFSLFSSDERKTAVYALTLCHNLKKVVFDALQTITISDASSQFISGNIALEEVSFPSLTAINNTAVTSAARILAGLTSVKTLHLPNLKTILDYNYDGSPGGKTSQILSYLSSLETLSLPSLETILYGRQSNGTSYLLSPLPIVTNLHLPNLRTIDIGLVNVGPGSKSILSGLSSLTSLVLPSLTSSIVSTGYGVDLFGGCVNLKYIEIGHISEGQGSITGNMYLSVNPTNTYADPEKLTALNASIREHWFANLRDYAGGAAHIITLPTAFVQHMEQTTKDVAAAKNWTLVTF